MPKTDQRVAEATRRHSDTVAYPREAPPRSWVEVTGLAAATPLGRALTSLSLAAALILPILLPDRGLLDGPSEWRVAVLLAFLNSVNIELGRWVEGRTTVSQRPHKALSVWAFATVLAVSPAWLLIVVPAGYAHAWWRGVRVPLWKWLCSAAFVILAACASGLLVSTDPAGAALDIGGGSRGPLLLLAAVLVFVVVESMLFWAVAYANNAQDEARLRATLARPGFYLTEVGALSVGALSVLVVSLNPGYAPLLIPAFAFMQQALVFAPLRQEARVDDKTGLLRFESWRMGASAERDRLVSTRQPWTLFFLDLDHFKSYNDKHGHLAGDVALKAVADTLVVTVRPADLICRFGGEEFAIFLPVDATTAQAVAERLRRSVAAIELPSPITISVGVATSSGRDAFPVELVAVLAAADRALYDAKHAGRNAVVIHHVD